MGRAPVSEPRRPQAEASPQDNPKARRTGRGIRRLRLNGKAAVVLLAVVAVSVVGYLVAVRLVNRNVRTQLLAGARAATEAGHVDQAIRNLQRYLESRPNDIPVLEELARITAE